MDLENIAQLQREEIKEEDIPTGHIKFYQETIDSDAKKVAEGELGIKKELFGSLTFFRSRIQYFQQIHPKPCNKTIYTVSAEYIYQTAFGGSQFKLENYFASCKCGVSLE